ncbi:hypothetical protein [Dokdonella sp.]|uniref:DUF7933 domain-containing protein n=1 Tax=Dokdonella sp. TaxID=2291710 RepID=UPI002F3F8019
MKNVSNKRSSNIRVATRAVLGVCIAAACGSAVAASAPHFSPNVAMPHASSARGPLLHQRGPNGTPACGSITITQSSTQTITPSNSVACNNGTSHTDNSYFRAFDLASLGAPNGLDVCEVQFGVEQATGASGTQPVTVNLYTSDPLFPNGFPGSLTAIGTATADVPNAASGTIYSVPVTGSAPAGSQLVVEVFTPDGSAAPNLFFIGSNTDAESGPSYLAAADCGLSAPADTASIGFPTMHIVLNAIGNAPGGDDVIFADGFDGVPTVAPTLAKAFAPTSVAVDTNSVLTLTLDNSGNAGPATLTSDLVDTFPAGLVVATPSDAATTCTGTASATDGGSTLTLASGAQIPAGGTCTVTVSVTSSTAGTYTNTIAAGGLQTDLGNSAADATADLNVTGGGGTHHAAMYTDRTEFLTHVSAGYYENGFDDAVPGPIASLSYTNGPWAYTVAASSDQLYNDTGLVSTNLAGDSIVVTFTSGAVTAVGGNFWATDINVQPTGTDVTITLSDATTETFTSTGPTDYRGFTTVAPITSITIDAPDTGGTFWPTMDNLLVGEGD